MAVVFAVAAAHKFVAGMPEVAEQFESHFRETWLPLFLVRPFGYSIAFIEAILALWLLTGFRLVLGWLLSGLLMVVLIFGLFVAREYSVAADNAIYLMVIVAGLCLCHYDKLRIG